MASSSTDFTVRVTEAMLSPPYSMILPTGLGEKLNLHKNYQPLVFCNEPNFEFEVAFVHHRSHQLNEWRSYTGDMEVFMEENPFIIGEDITFTRRTNKSEKPLYDYSTPAMKASTLTPKDDADATGSGDGMRKKRKVEPTGRKTFKTRSPFAFGAVPPFLDDSETDDEEDEQDEEERDEEEDDEYDDPEQSNRSAFDDYDDYEQGPEEEDYCPSTPPSTTGDVSQDGSTSSEPNTPKSPEPSSHPRYTPPKSPNNTSP